MRKSFVIPNQGSKEAWRGASEGPRCWPPSARSCPLDRRPKRPPQREERSAWPITTTSARAPRPSSPAGPRPDKTPLTRALIYTNILLSQAPFSRAKALGRLPHLIVVRRPRVALRLVVGAWSLPQGVGGVGRESPFAVSPSSGPHPAGPLTLRPRRGSVTSGVTACYVRPSEESLAGKEKRPPRTERGALVLARPDVLRMAPTRGVPT